MRPTKQHANIIKSRGAYGYDDDQLARLIGVTREVMHKWAKTDKRFALALDEAKRRSREFWEQMDDLAQRRDEYQRQLDDAADKRRRRSLGEKQADVTIQRMYGKHPLQRAPKSAAGARPGAEL